MAHAHYFLNPRQIDELTQELQRFYGEQTEACNPLDSTRRRANGFTLWLLLLLLVLVSACDSPAPPLKLGSNQWPGYEPIYLARELGYLDPGQVKLVELPASSDVMQHLRDGNLQAAMLTLDEVITLKSEGLPLRVILVLDVSLGADSVLARPEIQRPTDLIGRRIGVETTAVGAVMLESLLEKAGLSEEQVHIVHLTVDRHETAYRQGKVDAVITFEPTRSRLLALGAHEIFSSREIPGRIVDVLAVEAGAIPRHARQLEHLVDTYFRARDYLEQQRRQALEQMAPRLGLSPEALDQALQGLHLPDRRENQRWLADNGKLRQNASRLVRLMRRWHLISHPPELELLADDRFITP